MRPVIGVNGGCLWPCGDVCQLPHSPQPVPSSPTSVFASCPPRQKHKTQGADASIKTQKHKTQTKEYVKNTKTRVFSLVFSQN